MSEPAPMQVDETGAAPTPAAPAAESAAADGPVAAAAEAEAPPAAATAPGDAPAATPDAAAAPAGTGDGAEAPSTASVSAAAPATAATAAAAAAVSGNNPGSDAGDGSNSSAAAAQGEAAAVGNGQAPRTRPTTRNSRPKTGAGDTTIEAKIGSAEANFSEIKDRLFEDKIAALRTEAELIEKGQHDEFQKQLKALSKIKSNRIATATKWRDYQIFSINQHHAAEVQQAEADFQADRGALQERMLSALYDKQKKLEDEKSNDQAALSGTKRSTRNRAVLSETRKRMKMNPPHLNTALKENEVMDDLYAIQKQKPLPNTSRTSRRDGARVYSVAVERGQLFYQNDVYEKGSSVQVTEKTGSWYGTITMIYAQEVIVKDIDGTKSKIPLNNLRNGKCMLAPATM